MTKDIKDLSSFEKVENENVKNLIQIAYDKCKNQSLEIYETIQTITEREMLEQFLIPEEEIIPIKPLQVDEYLILSADEPNEEKYIDRGERVEMYLTNKRLLLVSRAGDENPSLEFDEEKIKVGYSKSSAYNLVAFPLNNIYGISFKIESKVKSIASIIPKKIGKGIGAGIFFLLVGIILFIMSSEVPRDLKDILANIGIVGITIGFLAILISLVSGRSTISEPATDTETQRLVNLVTLDPIYMKRASLRIFIDPEEHKPESILQWLRELQNRCEAVIHPKAFEKRMWV